MPGHGMPGDEFPQPGVAQPWCAEHLRDYRLPASHGVWGLGLLSVVVVGKS